MKKVIALLISVLMLVSVFAIPASATTKADLLAAVKATVIYPYVKASVDNMYRTINVSDEQAAKLLPLAQELAKIVPKDNGPTPFDDTEGIKYTDAQVLAVYKLIDQACAIMGWKFTSTLKTTGSFHPGDFIFYIHDANGKLLMSYDGDYVADTSVGSVAANGSIFSNPTLLAVSGSVLAAAAVALFVALRKKSDEVA